MNGGSGWGGGRGEIEGSRQHGVASKQNREDHERRGFGEGSIVQFVHVKSEMPVRHLRSELGISLEATDIGRGFKPGEESRN